MSDPRRDLSDELAELALARAQVQAILDRLATVDLRIRRPHPCHVCSLITKEDEES